MDTPEIPTTGGSYERQDDGSLKLVHRTEPASAPEAPASDPLAEAINRSARPSAPTDGEH